MSRSTARNLFIGLVSFLTLVDLFAAQALLPALTERFGVTPALMSTAVNASTLGMAGAGLVVALLAGRFNGTRAIWLCLLLLSIPTLGLSLTHDLALFAALRVVQGILMAAAFTLTMAHLSQSLPAHDAANALAAYVAGNVASNLIGRIVAAAAAVHAGLSGAFVLFAVLNIAGALIVRYGLLVLVPPSAEVAAPAMTPSGMVAASSDNRLRATYAIGFLILFAFIGTFSYVNFVLVAPPIGLGQMNLGWIYLVFLPALVATPFAGHVARRVGSRETLYAGFGLALLGLALTATHDLTRVLLGLALIGLGTFLAQAVMTALVGRLASHRRATASGLYLSSYYLGGMLGSIVLGALFDAAGWDACVLAIMGSMLTAAALVRFTGAGSAEHERSALSLR